MGASSNGGPPHIMNGRSHHSTERKVVRIHDTHGFAWQACTRVSDVWLWLRCGGAVPKMQLQMRQRSQLTVNRFCSTGVLMGNSHVQGRGSLIEKLMPAPGIVSTGIVFYLQVVHTIQQVPLHM
jgi:hypothetical protein